MIEIFKVIDTFLLSFKVGVAAVQLAKSLGLRVFGTASTEQGLKAVRELGADLVFNHKQEGYQQDILVSDRFDVFIN